MATETFPQVRLKPHNPKRGYLLRTYSIYGRKFLAGRWMPVSAEMAEYLDSKHQDAYDHDTPKAFDVAKDAKEKARIEEVERTGIPSVAPPPPPPPPSRQAEVQAEKAREEQSKVSAPERPALPEEKRPATSRQRARGAVSVESEGDDA